MSFRKRLCKNQTTEFLRDTFSATPLKVPEERMKPLMVLASVDDETKFRGELKFLLKDTSAFNLPVQSTIVSDVSTQRTGTMDADVGFSILDGFFKSLNFNSVALGFVLKGVKQMSLSFTNVQRQWIDLGALGQAVGRNNIDTENASLAVFVGEDAADMLLVTDAIVSNSFSINDESGSDTAFDASIPLIEKFVADGKLAVKVAKTSKTTITFTNATPLTFAFSCVKLEYDAATGKVAIRENVTPKRGLLPGDPERFTPHVLLDENEAMPGMLTLD
jgi:hypothetical protein